MPEFLKDVINENFHSDNILSLSKIIEKNKEKISLLVCKFKESYFTKEDIENLFFYFNITQENEPEVNVFFNEEKDFTILITKNNFTLINDNNKNTETIQHNIDILKSNKDELINIINYYFEIMNKNNKLYIDISTQLGLLYRAEKIDLFKKIESVLSLNKFDSLDDFIYEKYLKNCLISKELSLEIISLEFVTYNFEQECIVFNNINFTIKNYKSEKEKITLNNIEQTREKLKKELQKSFSINNILINTIFDLNKTINLSPTQNNQCFCDYNSIEKKINPMFLNKNINNF